MKLQLRIKDIRKCLLNRKTFISSHSKKRMQERGYTTIDIICCLLNGKIIESQSQHNSMNYVIEGSDYYNNPIITVWGENRHTNGYILVTVMPPIDKKRFSQCI